MPLTLSAPTRRVPPSRARTPGATPSPPFARTSAAAVTSPRFARAAAARATLSCLTLSFVKSIHRGVVDALPLPRFVSQREAVQEGAGRAVTAHTVEPAEHANLGGCRQLSTRILAGAIGAAQPGAAMYELM